MRVNLGWTVGLALCLVGVGTGCGREDSREAPLDAALDAPDASPPAAPVASSPESAPVPVSGWQVTPEPTPITFEVPACLPVEVPMGDRFAHPCGVKQFGPRGSLVSETLLDRQGRVLSEAAYQEGTGTRLWLIRHTYDDLGREVARVRSPGTGRASDTTEWVYDASGRLQLLLTDDSRTSYEYDARGELSFVQRLWMPTQDLSWQKFLYDPSGQLLTRWYAKQDYCHSGPTTPDPSCGEEFRRQLTYHSNGQLQEDDFVGFWVSFQQTKTFDERGRQLADYYVADEGGHRTAWTYDTRGLRVEEVHAEHVPSSETERRTRWLYDTAGRTGAEHIIEEWASRWVDPPPPRRTVKLNRYFHACGSGELLFVEQDANEDGTRDGWREVVRDTSGNLLVERYHGSLIQDASLSRVQYDYGCWK